MKPFLFAAAASAIVLAACSPAVEEGTPTVAPPPVEAVDTPIDEAIAEDTATPAEAETLVDVLATRPEFSSLLAAVDAAGLTETLAGPGPYTIFAPTNDAFAALPAGELDQLLLPENKDKLVRIVSYHVIPGKVLAAEVPAEEAGTATVSINNLDLSVRRTADGSVMVNQFTVTEGDIDAGNGVIHVIDGVLVPRMEE
ncbi:fasciclin domain-containing protein [Hyphomonas sp. WL0036]|uniref:fasciclin domain-containing protein n=1 Tax=Hyphomonas sediminis TaxID=2866160 RepID=UPI001C824C65|nr:fasciclin domain-containing protein [Hyphomonas sediminis]MBY9066176.1 fasciclin domain-containing protein [Hyphomonas sediminis]